jgi:hypothetical protein
MSNSEAISHFEDLWEKCESINTDISSDSISSILDELLLKINLYRTIDEQNKFDLNELKIIKSRTLGEILLTLTKLSLKDDINVFSALEVAFKARLV